MLFFTSTYKPKATFNWFNLPTLGDTKLLVTTITTHLIQHWLLLKVRLKALAKDSTDETQLLLMGRMLSEQIKNKTTIRMLSDVEFKVFSQWGDDGIIQWLVHNIDIPHKTFVEFGVENYQESNTRFLLLNNNWSGLVLDGSTYNIMQIKHANYFWKHQLLAKAAFIDADNINNLLANTGFDPNIGILHIDLDGNDYWIWRAISIISPIIVIIEYNSVFGRDRPITVPYHPTFNRTQAHYSNLYAGTSLAALEHLAKEKGYAFIGCNSAGNNAYFIRRDKLNTNVREISLEQGYVESNFRESRDEQGYMTYLSGMQRLKAITGLPVFNVISNQIELI